MSSKSPDLSGLTLSVAVATLGRSGWLVLTPQGLSPCKKRQALLGALTAPRSAARRAGNLSRFGFPRRAARRLQRGVMPLPCTRCLSPCNQFSDSRKQSSWHFDRRAFRRRLDFRGCFFVALRLVVLQYFSNSTLIPSWRIFRSIHLIFFRLCRSARFALGPNSYAVITKTKSGTGSGT